MPPSLIMIRMLNVYMFGEEFMQPGPSGALLILTTFMIISVQIYVPSSGWCMTEQ